MTPPHSVNYMTVIVRDFRPADAEGFARTRQPALPFMLCTAWSIAYDVAHAHPYAHFRPVVAEEDGTEVHHVRELG